MRKKFTSQGFTIIETLIVLSIIAIASAIVLPGLGGAANRRDLEMVAQNLVSDIRLVQQLSINSGNMDDRTTTLRFLTEKNGRQHYFINHNGSEIKKVYLPKTVRWATSDIKPIRFSVTGSPSKVSSENSSQTIQLDSSGCKPLFIKIAPVTGRVRVTSVASAGNE